MQYPGQSSIPIHRAQQHSGTGEGGQEKNQQHEAAAIEVAAKDKGNDCLAETVHYHVRPIGVGQASTDQPPELAVVDGRPLPYQQRVESWQLGEGHQANNDENTDANRQGYLDESIL